MVLLCYLIVLLKPRVKDNRMSLPYRHNYTSRITKTDLNTVSAL